MIIIAVLEKYDGLVCCMGAVLLLSGIAIGYFAGYGPTRDL